MIDSDVAMLEALRKTVHPLSDPDPHDALIDAVGNARLVLLGEASHGTHEFYQERARITQRLVVEKGFHAVAVEADWPDAYRVNRFIRGKSEDRDADTALSGFKRFPSWMWRNTDVLDFVRWLRTHNDGLQPGASKVGFYGLDLYSLYASIEEVLKYLEKVDPEAARVARQRYRCFDDFGSTVEEYARSAALGVISSCEDAVVKQLVDLLQQVGRLGRGGGDVEEEWFQAVQNARVVKNAEEYYRTMYRGNVESWNLRDQHMPKRSPSCSATSTAASGGASSSSGSTIHTSAMPAPPSSASGRAERRPAHARAARDGRLPARVHHLRRNGHRGLRMGWARRAQAGAARAAGKLRVALPSHRDAAVRAGLAQPREAAGALREPRLERAIGVLYLPATERGSHYFGSDPAWQFDSVIHLDDTRAVEPLERMPLWEAGEPAETYPTGL